ncbi:DUF3298 and DUF4163 domain-containing protein [Aminipila butyrica]|uniref:DUF3298 and DUF4163 domain-containing protein n=1 Tax=Aminipila butyrica TaxID=433296 RepID=A0A858C0W9_9FIRM|nr:DUF3298 and DUF4163 domain-containing protein [Aminipila butyrica]QIB70046.1 DUF3298 and DUF4163 domain-containing protein [Aminipila butyrica]
MQTVFQKTLKDTMYYNNIPVFIYQINYPCFMTTCSTISAVNINNHYIYNAKQTETYCRTVLYSQALDSARYLQPASPFNSYTFDVDFEITYNAGCFTSLYMDTSMYLGGAHGQTKRESDTWDFKTGNRLFLSDLCPNTPDYLSKLQTSIINQIRKRLQESPGSYFDDYETLLRDSFNPNSFYLIPNGFIIYFQQYDIAPYVSGMPEFSFSLRLDHF